MDSALWPGGLKGSRHGQQDPGKGLHKDEDHDRIHTQGYRILNQTDGEKVFPFHAVHEVEPQGIEGAGDDKFSQARRQGAQGRHLRAVENQAEQKAQKRIADGKAREEGAGLGSREEADDIARKACGHSHDRSAVSRRGSQGKKGEAEFQKFRHLNAEKGERHIGGHEKAAEAEALYPS